MALECLSVFSSFDFFIPSLAVILLLIVIRIAVSTDFYKKFFAKLESNFSQATKGIFAPLKQKIFVDLSNRLKELEGDVLEIGIGAGENFHLYPEGTSLIAVDSNPHVEKLLTENLKKTGERVHLKKFVVASAEDMSCSSGKVGVEDNSIAAVVCTLVLCSLTDDQTTKTIREVKRVLVPVSKIHRLLCFVIFPGEWRRREAGSTSTYGLDRYVPPDTVWCLRVLFLPLLALCSQCDP